MSGFNYKAVEKGRSELQAEVGMVDAPDIETALERAKEKSRDGARVISLKRINP